MQIASEVEALIGPDAVEILDFEAIETAARCQALAVAARAVEQRFNCDTSDYVGPTLLCRCGQKAEYAGRRPKTFKSALGELTLQRAYYHCKGCNEGVFPRDQALGMVSTSLSPAVTRMVGVVGAKVSFLEGSELLAELAGINVDPKQVERKAEQLGAEIAADEQVDVSHPEPCELPTTLYLGMDGTGIPMCPSELVNRPGKQVDGTSKTREVKLCTVWSAERHDEKGIAVRDQGSVTYTAAIESAACKDTDKQISKFAKRVEREALRRGFYDVERQVVLGDGAPWIWNIAQELFPDAILIVDRFHAKEKLAEVSKSIYGAGTDLAVQWALKRWDELDDGNIEAIITALNKHACSFDEARKAAGYFKNNKARMLYAKFHEQGLCTSTGVVEAGCKHVIGTRLKRSGMHWSVPGANAVIALRCSCLSGRFEDFWERRAEGICGN